MPSTRRERGQALLRRARQLRREMTPAEQLLWHALRRGNLQGLHVRRQAMVGPFIADFVVMAARLVIELDGAVHDTQPERDRERTEWLERSGYRVLRFRNEHVLDDLPDVLANISRACGLSWERARAPPTARSLPAGAGARAPP